MTAPLTLPDGRADGPVTAPHARAPGPAEPVDLAAFPSLLEPLSRWRDEYGDVTRFETCEGEVGFSVCAPELAAHVLRDNHRNYTRGYGVDRVKLILPGGLLVDEGEAWQRHRSLARPLFRRRTLGDLASGAHDQARRMATRWAEQARAGSAIDVTRGTSEFALRCILDSLLGPAEASTSPFLALAHDLHRDLAFARRFRALRPLARAILDAREAPGASAEGLLPLLLDAHDGAGEPFTREELVDQVLTFIVAGHETTASALAWVWTLLATHPEVEARFHDELAAARTRGATDAELLELPYLRQIVDEALRLRPPVWLLTRRALAPDTLGAIAIPAGAQVFLPLFLLLRHPRHWPFPEEFLPSRFAAPAPERHPLAYLPFGTGPRRCVGEHLALLDMRCHLVHAASLLELRLAGPGTVEIDAQVNLRPRGQLQMTGRLRNSAA